MTKEIETGAREMIEEKIGDILKTKGLVFEYEVDAIGYDGEDDPDEEHPATLNVTVRVPFKDYGETTNTWYARECFQVEQDLSESLGKYSVSIRLQAIVPSLVPAKLGDFVLVFSSYDHDEDELHVGLVTSVIKDENGDDMCYGCRHVLMKEDVLGGKFELGNKIVGLTSEDYGGYPVGFYRVISEKEAAERVVKMANKEIEKRILEIREKLDELGEDFIAGIKRYKHRTVYERLSDKEIHLADYED